MNPNLQIERTETILRLIMEGTATTTGEAFFYQLVRHLALVLDVRYAFISEFIQNKTRVRTLAFWDKDDYRDNVEYILKGSPCEVVLCGKVTFYPENIQSIFPNDTALVQWNAESYLAIPLVDRQGQVLGHLAVIDDKPMISKPSNLSIFEIFAARAMAELERVCAEHAKKKSERWLANILESTIDSIISIDQQQNINLFNRAAEAVFQCDNGRALGQSFKKFLAHDCRQLFTEYLDKISQADAGQQQLWIPEGLIAQRVDGEEFPIEATISAVKLNNENFFTIILRDVNQRKRIEEALRKLQAENMLLQKEISGSIGFPKLIGDTAIMQALYEEVEAVATTESSVLIMGETGTGKELIAQALHQASARKDKILIKINCAALPGELIESELFGHEKGAFTGATQQRKGRFELANNGTIFLDEVGELSPQAQAKLLRVLQEQEFERVGGVKTIIVDVRLIAATNRDLLEMVLNGSFRSDLYYRLNVFPLQVPALRERSADVPRLARYFLAKLSRKLGRTFEGISADSMKKLEHYQWPGNVRELQNIIERAAILSKGTVVEINDALISQKNTVNTSTSSMALEQIERNHILQVLESCNGVIEGKHGAAIILGLKPSTLRFRLKKLDISKANHSK